MLETAGGRRAWITLLSFAVLIGLVYLVARNMVLSGFDSVDQNMGREMGLRMRFALRAQGAQLESLGLNWADWTAAYDYVSTPTSQKRRSFEEQELTTESLSVQDCDLFSYLSTEGESIFSVAIDHQEKVISKAPPAFLAELRDSGLCAGIKSHSSQVSLICVEGKPLLVSIQRVHRSGLPAQWNGALAVGQWVDGDVRKSLQEQLRVPITVASPKTPAHASDTAAPLSQPDDSGSIVFSNEHNDEDDDIEVKTAFSDPRSTPILWVSTRVPRLAREQGLVSLHSFLVALIGLGVVSVVVALSLQNRLARSDAARARSDAERTRSDAALQRETQAFDLITRHLPDPLFVRDLREGTTRVYGASSGPEGDWLDALLLPEQRLQRSEWLFDVSASGQRAEHEWAVNDSTWFELVTPVKAEGETAPVSHLVGAAIDISERKRAEREKDVLLKEIHHRVKNNLQIVVSLLNLQADTIPDAATREGFLEARARVRSMALIHEQLYRQTDLSHVDFGSYLESLLQLLVRSYRSTPVRLHTEIEPIPLDLDLAVPCGLIVTELVANSFKHAFAPALVGARSIRGELTVRLRSEHSRRVLLQIEDNGPGIPADFCLEESESLGLQIVDSLATQIGATIEVGNVEGESGTLWTLCFEALETSKSRIQV